MPVHLLYLLAMIFSALPAVLVFLSVVVCVIFSVLPVVLVFLVAVAGVIFPVLPVVLVFLAAVVDLFCAACSLTLCCGGGLDDLFCTACCLCCGGGLGDLFCPVSSGGTSANGSILNSNVSSSSTILCRQEVDSSNSLVPNALLFRNPFSATHCSDEICTASREYRVHFDFETSSILCTYKQSTYSSRNPRLSQ